ncbi:hypothetical protein [Lactococcus lactis]|uniref:hypothetical protein n=1 Tax=Lactococcus lactis TaxID=1358 RepID=UPI001911BB92|nr:hypothetical protein [Lactococcus lactis]MDG4974994.1 hypothetical protein [Lactococcus lactis]WDA67327.1 hypothetical protein IL310_00175 [Lactococcus lactis]
MSAPYTYIAQDIKDTHDLYERVINSGRMLDEDEIISKEKIDKLYKVIMEIEAQEKT